MRDIENTIDRVSNPSPRRTKRAALAAALPLAGLLMIVGCDGMDIGEGDPVDVQTSALRNTGGRTPDQQKCDDKLQACYVDCSVKYPESGGGLNDDLREGCFDSCDASHNLCAPALTAGTAVNGVLQPGAVLDAATAPTTTAAIKSCSPTTDGGLWCCVPISTPPVSQCSYTPPPDTIWTVTQTATRAP